MQFPRSLVRLSVTLLPEYLIAVFALGALRGVLFPFDGSAVDWSLAIVVLAAVIGTVMVIPTAGEVPILQGLAAAGAPIGPLGARLITLPAISPAVDGDGAPRLLGSGGAHAGGLRLPRRPCGGRPALGPRRLTRRVSASPGFPRPAPRPRKH